MRHLNAQMDRAPGGAVVAEDRELAFRRVAGAFATGVGIASSTLADIPVAMTVNAFTTVSLAPTLVLACLEHRCRLLSWIRSSGVFSITVLSADQEPHARWFANARRPTGAAAFAGARVRQAPATGCLIFSEGLAYFDCRVHDLVDQGDHAVVVGEALAFDTLNPGKAPLLFLRGRYVSIEAPREAVRP